MDFSLTDEQQMLLDTARRFAAERYTLDYRKRVRDSEEGWSRETWNALAELGMLGLNVPESDGGIGADPVAAMVVGITMGECMSLEPFRSSAVVATRAITVLGSPEQRQRWLPKMMAGELVAVLVCEEASIGGSVTDTRIRAVRRGDGWRLNGRKPLVYHVPAAELLLVSAHMDDDTLGLFAVSKDTAGLQLLPRATVDDQRAAEVVLDDVDTGPDGRLGQRADAAVQDALDAGLVVLCADAFGAMDKLLAATIEYSLTRVQFGVPIASFQALQHRMVDMFIHLEQARSMLYLATLASTDPDRDARRTTLDAAKFLMGRSARYIAQQAVQLHGGMGMTDELGISHYFKRLLAFEYRGGTTEQRLNDYRIQSSEV